MLVRNLRYVYNCVVRVVGYEGYSSCVGASSSGNLTESMKLDEFECNGGVHWLDISSPLVLDRVVCVREL